MFLADIVSCSSCWCECCLWSSYWRCSLQSRGGTVVLLLTHRYTSVVCLNLCSYFRACQYVLNVFVVCNSIDCYVRHFSVSIDVYKPNQSFAQIDNWCMSCVSLLLMYCVCECTCRSVTTFHWKRYGGHFSVLLLLRLCCVLSTRSATTIWWCSTLSTTTRGISLSLHRSYCSVYSGSASHLYAILYYLPIP